MRTIQPAHQIRRSQHAESVRLPSQQTPTPQQSFAQVLKGLAQEVDRGESAVTHALRGNPLADDPKGMIALQAGVYRYVEAVDLVTRLVDRAANAVKTTLQNQ